MNNTGSDCLDERTIILVGETGNGKSSLGNFLLGGNKFKANGGMSHVTTSSEMKESISGSPGIRLKIVDTPGLFDIDMRIEKTVLLVQQSLELIPQPNLFLIVFRCDVRLTDHDKMSLSWLKLIFGDKAIQHTLVVFTHGAKYLTDNAFRANLLKTWPEMSEVPTDQIYIIENIAPNQPERTARLLDKIRGMSQPYDCDRTIAKSVLKKYCETVDNAIDLITRTANIHRDIQNEERKAQLINFLKYGAGIALLGGGLALQISFQNKAAIEEARRNPEILRRSKALLHAAFRSSKDTIKAVPANVSLINTAMEMFLDKMLSTQGTDNTKTAMAIKAALAAIKFIPETNITRFGPQLYFDALTHVVSKRVTKS